MTLKTLYLCDACGLELARDDKSVVQVDRAAYTPHGYEPRVSHLCADCDAIFLESLPGGLRAALQSVRLRHRRRP